MCGIVGFIDNVEGRVEPQLLQAMRDVMNARGPDGDGQYIEGAVGMAMRRLSIIDIEGGAQPFLSREDEVITFQNGEIYNYRELKTLLEKRGHQFQSLSDTEVLAHGFTEWGADGLLQRIDGMYAIAILDRKARELHLARDRFGEKPLFYTLARGRFAYSSSLLALAGLDWVSDDINVQSLDRYLALHYVPGDATIFKSIKRVLPGERLVVPIDNPVPTHHRYYTLPLGKEKTVSDNDLAELIEAAIESRLVADVPVGIFLSGGLDSSILAAVAAKKHPGIATFSMGFQSASHDESPYAQLVANQIRSTHHHFSFDENSFRSLLPQVTEELDEPVGDQALLPLYWLCREARRHVKVALSGEGADEVFAGYSYYRNGNLSGWRNKLKLHFGKAGQPTEWSQRLTNNVAPVTPSGFPLLTDIATRQRLTRRDNSTIDSWEENLFGWLNESRDSLQRANATDISTWLVDDLLIKFDRMSMAHSLEGRAPYLTPSIVETGVSLPSSQKMNGEISKVALRRVARQWLPEKILERRKQGFVLPMAKWLEQWFAVGQGQVADYFDPREVPGLDMKEVSRITEEDLAHGVRRERLLFALLMLVEWYQSFQSRRREVASRYRKSERGVVEQASLL